MLVNMIPNHARATTNSDPLAATPPTDNGSATTKKIATDTSVPVARWAPLSLPAVTG